MKIDISSNLKKCAYCKSAFASNAGKLFLFEGEWYHLACYRQKLQVEAFYTVKKNNLYYIPNDTYERRANFKKLIKTTKDIVEEKICGQTNKTTNNI